MKLKTKIYLFQIFFATTLLFFIYHTYASYKQEYENSLFQIVSTKANYYKKEFLNSYNQAQKKIYNEKKLFREIHERALEILKENNKISLFDLVKRLKTEFDLKHILINIYLIDKNYVIYKTTYPKDLGLDLSNIKDAKYYLDRVKKEKKIFISDFISIDALDMEFNLYSYSYLDNDTFLELGFKDSRIHNLFIDAIKNNKTKLYGIIKTKTLYTYYEFRDNRKISKEEFFQKIKKIPIISEIKDDIINSYLKNSAVIRYENHYATITIPLFEKDMYETTGYNNIVLKLKVDISKQQKSFQRYTYIFYLSFFTILLFFILLYFTIEKNFTKPIEKILKSINQKEELKDDKILNKGDEFSIIAKEYNKLLKSLKIEIKSNKKLLENNRRFIADTVHQIRTPLTNIMMNSEMIKRIDKSDKFNTYINQINASINMLSNSYEDLSYIISRDTIEYKASHISLSKTLHNRIDFFKTLAEVNLKTIEYDIEDNLFYNINTIELERLYDNNISNAVRYAKRHKPITITLKSNKEDIILTFKSFGNKIRNPQEIFEQNYRENSSKRGLGLGLNIVKNICQKYNILYKVSYEEEQNIFVYIFRN